MELLQQACARVVKEVFNISIAPVFTRPDEQFGDYATNVALQLAKQVGKPPREIAMQLAPRCQKELQGKVSEVTVAGAGFLNFRLSDEEVLGLLHQKEGKPQVGQEVLVEFGDPNPFKAMHLGHLYTTIVGDAIANLIEAAGASVQRLGYHGDVGMHVARTMWALLKYDGDVHDALSSDVKIGQFYAQGAAAYKEDPQAKKEIEDLNRQIYELRLQGESKGADSRLAEIYKIGFERSFSAFKALFAELGVDYKRHYLESESTKTGLAYVKEYTGKVFEESDGAIVYKGEKAGLHTRVFINSRGLPTYEAKDLGLAELKDHDYPKAATSIIITSQEQTDYFKVMLAALHEINPQLSAKTRHIPHGFLSLTAGKMSSRQGISEQEVAANLLVAVREAVAKQFPAASSKVQQAIYLAAVKYTFIKNRIGGDVTFNVEESVALEGNSGPYLQYAHARARSVLAKGSPLASESSNLDSEERRLALKIGEYPEALTKATSELLPHYVCTYLYELAQTFNRFYEKNRVIGDPREKTRLYLIERYADVVKSGLGHLGIAAPDHM